MHGIALGKGQVKPEPNVYKRLDESQLISSGTLKKFTSREGGGAYKAGAEQQQICKIFDGSRTEALKTPACFCYLQRMSSNTFEAK